MKERVLEVISHIPAGFLSKTEVELLVGVMFEHKGIIGFTDTERGNFSQKYYPDYVIQMIPHEPWQKKPIRFPPARREEVLRLIKEQVAAGKHELSSASYQSTIFAMDKKGGMLRVVHDLQPLNAVTIRDATLPLRIEDMINSFSGRVAYGLFELKAGYNNQMLSPKSRDLMSFFVDEIGLLQLTRLPQGHTNSVAEFQWCTQHMIGPMLPKRAEVFIDDCAAKGPKLCYGDETIKGNDQIRWFVWEYAGIVQELLACINESGVTVSVTNCDSTSLFRRLPMSSSA